MSLLAKKIAFIILLVSSVMLFFVSTPTFAQMLPLLTGNGTIPPGPPPDYEGLAFIEGTFDFNTNYKITCMVSNPSTENITISIGIPNLESIYDSATFRGVTVGIDNLFNDFILPPGTYSLTVNGYHLIDTREGINKGLLEFNQYSKKNSVTLSGCNATIEANQNNR